MEVVALELRHEAGRWWIVDPPTQRVHIDTLIRVFEHDVTTYSPGAIEAQKLAGNAGYEELVKGLAALRSLRGERAKPPRAR
jgi:hypothetical protein